MDTILELIFGDNGIYFTAGCMVMILLVIFMVRRNPKNQKDGKTKMPRKVQAFVIGLFIVAMVPFFGPMLGLRPPKYFHDLVVKNGKVLLFHETTMTTENSNSQSVIPTLHVKTVDMATKKVIFSKKIGSNFFVQHLGHDFLLGRNHYRGSSYDGVSELHWMNPENGEMKLIAEKGKSIDIDGKPLVVAKIESNFLTLQDGSIREVMADGETLEERTSTRGTPQKKEYYYRQGSNQNKSVLVYKGKNLEGAEYMFPKVVEESEGVATVLSYEDFSKTLQIITLLKDGKVLFQKKLEDLWRDAKVKTEKFQRTAVREGKLFCTAKNVLVVYALETGELLWRMEVE